MISTIFNLLLPHYCRLLLLLRHLAPRLCSVRVQLSFKLEDAERAMARNLGVLGKGSKWKRVFT
jgi:hypothetical protein